MALLLNLKLKTSCWPFTLQRNAFAIVDAHEDVWSSSQETWTHKSTSQATEQEEGLGSLNGRR